MSDEDITKRFSEASLVRKYDDESSTLADERNAYVEDLMKTDARFMDIETGLHDILIEVHNALKHISHLAKGIKYNAT